MTDRVAIFGQQPTKVRRLPDGMDVPVVAIDGSAVASNGASIPVEKLTQTLAYDGSGKLSTVSVTHNGITYTQTLSYDGSGRLSSVSAWDAQP